MSGRQVGLPGGFAFDSDYACVSSSHNTHGSSHDLQYVVMLAR